MADKKNFATTGTESYNLEEQTDKQEQIKKQPNEQSPEQTPKQSPEQSPEQTPKQAPEQTPKQAPKQTDDKIILNIQEEPKKALLEKKKKKYIKQGKFFTKINDFLILHSKVKLKDKSTFFHLLSVMINAGIPMVKSLYSLTEQLKKTPRLRLIVTDLGKEIERGGNLSEAMFAYKDVFSDAEIGMVQAGEASGQLSSVLKNLARDAEKSYAIRSKVKSAMTYPIVVIMLLFVVVAGMLVFVVPKLTELFAQTEGQLPLITRIVVGLSNFIVERTVLFSVSILGIILFLILFKKTDNGRYFFDNLKLKLPVFGKLFQQSYLAKFSRSLSSLLDSNISIVKTLEITANSIGNEVYRKKLMLSMEDIKQGIPLAENLTANELFPPMLVNMIDVGEQTAQLDEIALKVAVFYENEVDNAVAGISKIIEPVILIVIGVSVGIIVGAVMLPIMQLTDMAGVM